MLDSGCSLHVDLRLIHDSVVIGVFSDTADPISAHGTPGSIQIVHVHLKICHLGWFDQNQSVRTDSEMTVTDFDRCFPGIFNLFFKTVYIYIIISDALHLREFHIFSPICSIPCARIVWM